MDTARVVRFYGEMFGWKFSRDAGLPMEYWRIETGGARGGLLRRPTATPPAGHGTNAFVCSMEVGDSDAAAKTVLGLGRQVALPKFAAPGVCWQGYFLDTEGNTFGLFQPDPAAAGLKKKRPRGILTSLE